MNNQIIELYTNALKQLAAQGISLHSKIKHAKTKVKQDYYKKKVKQNSEKAARVLVKLERVAPTSTTKEPGDEPTSALTG